MKVENMTSSRGNKIANQFIIKDDNGTHFQSYESMIAFIPYDHSFFTPESAQPHQKIHLDRNKWDYSTTTGKYRNQFLGETKRETEKKIKSGEYILADLN